MSQRGEVDPREQIQKLEKKLQAERDARRDLEHRVDALSARLDTLQTILTGDHILDDIITEQTESVYDELEALKTDDVGPEYLLEAQANENALPIQQLTAGRKAGHVTDDKYKKISGDDSLVGVSWVR